MTRVLLVSDLFPPDIGGPATYTDRLARALSDRGHQVRVVCSSEARYHPDDRRRPFAVHRVDRTNRYRYEVEMRARVMALLLWADRVLVGNLERYVAPPASLLRKGFATKIVGDVVWETMRNRGLTIATFDEFQQSGTDDPLGRALAAARFRQLSSCQLVVTPSDYLRQVVIGWGMDPDRVATVNNGVDTDPGAQPIVERGSIPFVAGYVGRLTNWKGVETLLCALHALPDIRGIIVGDGPELPLLQGLANQLGIGAQVSFRGRLSADRVRAELTAFHVLVLDSAYEGMSHTLLEAGALGVPAIASDCCGNPEVITDGLNGRLVPYGDVEALTTTLTELRDNEALRLRLARSARETAARFSFDITVSRTIEVLGL